MSNIEHPMSNDEGQSSLHTKNGTRSSVSPQPFDIHHSEFDIRYCLGADLGVLGALAVKNSG